MDEPKDHDEMTLQRFARIVDAYGGRASRWPECERDVALRLVERSAEAQAMVAQCSGLDDLLDAAPALAPSRSVRARILAAAPVASRSWADLLDDWASNLWPVGRGWQPLGALAVATVLGIAAGLIVPNGADTESDVYETSDLLLDDVADPGDLP
jgi:hypothetical protein